MRSQVKNPQAVRPRVLASALLEGRTTIRLYIPDGSSEFSGYRVSFGMIKMFQKWLEVLIAQHHEGTAMELPWNCSL